MIYQWSTDGICYPMPGRTFADSSYRYGFSGQESDNEVYGLRKMYGYEFREYDTRLGRWWGIDPLAGKYPSLSPYSYCAGSPMVMVDLWGGFIGDFFDYQGKYLGTDGKDDGKIYIVDRDTWIHSCPN